MLRSRNSAVSASTLTSRVTHATSRVMTSAMATRSAADRKSTRLNSSHANTSYAVFCVKKKLRVHSGGAKRQQLNPPEPVGLGLADHCGDRVYLVLVEAERGGCKVVFEMRACCGGGHEE